MTTTLQNFTGMFTVTASKTNTRSMHTRSRVNRAVSTTFLSNKIKVK